MDILKDVFLDTLNREGQMITINENTFKVFFRRNETDETISYSTLYALSSDSIEQGELFTMNHNNFLIIKELTTENEIYRKYTCIKCNASIKWMFGKNDIVTFPCYMKNISATQLSNNGLIVLGSKVEIWLSLNANSERIPLDGRFFCGSYISVNKVIDLNHLNGICYLYAERDTITADDDSKNGIADRWKYETPPSTYVVDIVESEIEVDKNATKALNVSVKKDNVLMSPTPTLNWNIADTSVCTVDESNNVKGISAGQTKLTASYQPSENDICESDSIDVIVNDEVIVGDIVVTPSTTTSYKLLLKDTQKFTCSISGLSLPQWNITLNSNGNTSSNYTSVINNELGTFTVTNNKQSMISLIYTIQELTTQKTATYTIT